MWSSAVIDFLAEAKRAGGVSFDVAWQQALAAHPPFGRDRGSNIRALFVNEQDFDGPDEPLVDFLERACRDAWNGENPLLRHLIGIREMFDTDDGRDVAVGVAGSATSNRVVA